MYYFSKVGLSLSEAEASIAASFTSKFNSIFSVVNLLREGMNHFGGMGESNDYTKMRKEFHFWRNRARKNAISGK